MQLQFIDKTVSYDTFLNDLAARLKVLIHQSETMPEYISQRKAYKVFGRGNVERWLRQGKLHPCKRPGKVEYRTEELQIQQRTVQDYF